MKQTVLAIALCFAVFLMFDQSPRGWTEQRIDAASSTDSVAVDNAIAFP